jgi:hypothetical protein
MKTFHCAMMPYFQTLFGDHDSIGRDPDSMDAESGNQDPCTGGLYV